MQLACTRHRHASQRKVEIVSKVHEKVYSLCELDSALALFGRFVAASARLNVCAHCHRLLNEFYVEIKF